MRNSNPFSLCTVAMIISQSFGFYKGYPQTPHAPRHTAYVERREAPRRMTRRGVRVPWGFAWGDWLRVNSTETAWRCASSYCEQVRVQARRGRADRASREHSGANETR